jgi:hypothetical protein
MKVVRAVGVVEAPGIEAEQLWLDRSRWASWLEGFSHLVTLDDGWPVDGRRVYDGPRGRVLEKILRHTAGSGYAATIEDARMTGVITVTFETDNVRTRITVELDVEPKEQLAPGRRWWLRRKLREEWETSLRRFGYELAAERRAV